MLGNLIGGFIVILVGVNLIPSVADQVVAAQAGNVTGAASTILGLTTLFFALGIAAAGIAVAAQGLRAAGLVGV
mgnify:FL=1|tara:strand:- start:374 stop:595 length:222 start_codon:yes stop_codon:yes gene_type:complete